ncbi:MAG: anti sigma factor C-terminal domain-containing protein [Actinomycetota bacterium]|nr:MAG: hypothetical protein FD171_266 [Actinomycetota bacterium]MDO8949415.1 anti sigma factor C-terminal domain-containing protein [Actinomycetota bacterium]MDP3629838.1 anti sigma factor C-terminal domain-containing protein [Actinomycetota bacterium]
MNTNDRTTGEATPATGDQIDDEGSPTFDERAFIRSARAKSMRRTTALASLVVLVALCVSAGGWVAWNIGIQAQSNRVTAYQYELVSLSQPNTFISGTGRTDLQFPGARNTYAAYRPVGSRPAPRGDVTIEFEIWGGEVASTAGELMSWQAPVREFSGAQMAPALRFLYPLEASAASVPEEAQLLAAATVVTRQRLEAAPASATAEIAVSFKARKTLAELEAWLPSGVTLNWGAVDVWAPEKGPIVTADGSMVGIAFVGPDGIASPVARTQLEKDVVDDLHFIAELAPKGTADRCTTSADFLAQNGVRYYGAVVTGSVSDIRKLLAGPDASCATLGFVVEPWE